MNDRSIVPLIKASKQQVLKLVLEDDTLSTQNVLFLMFWFTFIITYKGRVVSQLSEATRKLLYIIKKNNLSM